MKKLSGFLLLLLAVVGCSSHYSSFSHYQYHEDGVPPAHVSGGYLINEYTRKKIGQIYIAAIDSNKLENSDKENTFWKKFLMGSRGGYTVNPDKKFSVVPVSSGKHTYTLGIEIEGKNILSNEFSYSFDAKSNQTYYLVATYLDTNTLIKAKGREDIKVPDIANISHIKVFAADVTGMQVSKEENLSIQTRQSTQRIPIFVYK